MQQPLPKSIKIGDDCKKQIEVVDRAKGGSMMAYMVQGLDSYPTRGGSEVAYVSQGIDS